MVVRLIYVFRKKWCQLAGKGENGRFSLQWVSYPFLCAFLPALASEPPYHLAFNWSFALGWPPSSVTQVLIPQHWQTPTLPTSMIASSFASTICTPSCIGPRRGYCHGGIHLAKPPLYRARGSSIMSSLAATADPSHRAIGALLSALS